MKGITKSPLAPSSEISAFLDISESFVIAIIYQGLLSGSGGGRKPNLVPRAFPLKNGWGGKRPWHRLVTCPLVHPKIVGVIN